MTALEEIEDEPRGLTISQIEIRMQVIAEEIDLTSNKIKVLNQKDYERPEDYKAAVAGLNGKVQELREQWQYYKGLLESD